MSHIRFRGTRGSLISSAMGGKILDDTPRHLPGDFALLEHFQIVKACAWRRPSIRAAKSFIAVLCATPIEDPAPAAISTIASARPAFGHRTHCQRAAVPSWSRMRPAERRWLFNRADNNIVQ